MRNKEWLRYSLASLTIVGAAFGAGLVACGDDDDNTTPKADGGTADSTTGTDGASGDATTDSTTTPPKPNAKLQLANAATDLGPNNTSGALRFCYAIGPVYAPLPPIPDTATEGTPFPGVFIGTGGAAQGTGADLSGLAITPVLMNAETLAARGIVRGDAGAGPSCGDLIGPDKDAGGQGPLVENVDYWKLATIPAGTLLKEKSFVLVLTGCTSDATSSVAKCGPDFTATGAPGLGNLKTTVYELDRATAIEGDKIGTQFIHASPQAESFLAGQPGGALKVIPGYITDPNNPTTFKGILADADGGVALHAKTPLAQVQGVTVASDSFTANPNVPPIAISLPKVQLLTYGGKVPDGGAYRNGAAFTFIALGDPLTSPDAGGGAFNTKTFHYIALPNDPQ